MQSTKLADLRAEYDELFETCVVRSGRAGHVDEIVNRILPNRARYETVERLVGCPWWLISVIHNMEASLDFWTHLHNGDSLRARTFHEPKGRPKIGMPPFPWEASAADALAFDGFTAWKDWSVAGVLYKLEGYNGWGTRRRGVCTPYLWSFSTHYEKGKFVADQVWNSEAVSKQCGAAVILRRLAELGAAEFPDAPAPPADAAPLVPHYRVRKSSDPDEVLRAEELQQWLDTYQGVWVRVDGVPGRRTSAAYRLVTGHYLPGDPRIATTPSSGSSPTRRRRKRGPGDVTALRPVRSIGVDPIAT